MFPNPWTSTVTPSVTKPLVNYENNTQSYPFYATPNTLQNMNMSQQGGATLNTSSMMTQSLQPNAIDPAMVQKWQEWKRWELWQHQFQQWQQQTGHVTATTSQPAPPPIPPSLPSQPSSMPFQNQQFAFNQPKPPLPQTNQPNLMATNNNEVRNKRGLEPEFQNNEKKLKTDTLVNKKEIELNDETEALFEEQFKSWEESFLKWKEQNKNHPDKTQYLEYEKKWLTWQNHLKQKCEALKKKRELKMAEKKKEEENKQLSQLSSDYKSMVSNVNLMNEPPPSLQHLHNNSSMIPPISEHQIPGLDLVSNNENSTKGFLNVSNILQHNQNGPIQTPDDKPFNFPKSMTNAAAVNPYPASMPLGNMNHPSVPIHQSSPNWPKYNSPVSYYNQKPPDVNNSSISRFGQQTDISSRLPYGGVGGDTPITTLNNSQNSTNVNYRRPFEGSFNNPSSETSAVYNKSPDNQLYNRNVNSMISTNNFRDYNQPNTNLNTSNFNTRPENSNIPYQQPRPPLNTTPSKPPSLLSLNLVKPISLDKPGNYLDSKNAAPNRYERNWNDDEEDNPEDEYMEAHKKFSSETFDDQNDDQFSNKQHRNVFNENHYSRGQQSTGNLNNDYSKPFNKSRAPQGMLNPDKEYTQARSQFSRNIGHEMQTLKPNEDSYYKYQNNSRNIDQGFPRGAPFSKNNDEEDYSNETTLNKNNFVPNKGNYGSSSIGNYGPSRSGFGNNKNATNMEWDKDYNHIEGPPQPFKDIPIQPPVIIKQLYQEAPPIDPIKIFDYRHLPTLKVIPGISKETVVPIRVYDYKHGGKRILPWQDRGYSRRNANQSREDLNKKEDNSQNNADDLDNTKETLIRKPTFTSNNKSSNDKEKNFGPNKTNEVKEITSTIIDTIIIQDDEVKEEKREPEIKTIDIYASSPPRVSKVKEVEKPSNRQLLKIETLLCPPGRVNRPSKIVIILRGLPGSGKSHVAKLIKEKEVEMGGQAPRILSLDDYFMTEVTKTEIDPESNKQVEIKVMEYEHDSANENLYRTSFIKAFKKKILENYFSFYIIDAINNKVTYYKDILEISRINGFTAYIIELECDVDLCIKRNIHNRTAHDINSIMRSWVKTPDDQILLDIKSLLHLPSNSEMEMEDVSDVEMEVDKDEETIKDNVELINDDENDKSEENTNVEFEEEDVMKLLSCKWTDTIPQEEKMKRLDGLCKKKTENSIKEWLQIPEDAYTINEQIVVKDGKKRVRWADMEERREQEKMRAIGFVVGQTDWDRMLGRDQGESKLTQTKYI